MTDHSEFIDSDGKNRSYDELLEILYFYDASELPRLAISAIQSLQAENARLEEEAAEFSRAYGLICAERNRLEAEVKALMDNMISNWPTEAMIKTVEQKAQCSFDIALLALRAALYVGAQELEVKPKEPV